MAKEKDSEKISLALLLLKLYQDGETTVVSVSDERRTIKIHINRGHVVFADGIDLETPLLKEIANKKGLSKDQLDDLMGVLARAPRSLGQILVDKRLIGGPLWTKFLEVKVKRILGAAFQMENAELTMTPGPFDLPPLNEIDYNLPRLLHESIREIKVLENIHHHIPGEDAVYEPAGDMHDLMSLLPLTPSEREVLAMIDGKRNVGEIISSTSLDTTTIYHTLYMFICFEMIQPHEAGETKAEKGDGYEEMINLYMDLLRIIETNFRREAGKQFDTIFPECKDELKGKSKELFSSLDPSKDSKEDALKGLSGYLADLEQVSERDLLIKTSFNKLIYLLIMKMKNLLGIGLTQNTLKEMMDILQVVEKYHQDSDMPDYLRKNLEDYMDQISS